MKQTDLWCMYTATPLLFKSRFPTGVNQYGSKPTNALDYAAPSQLINYGRGTTFDTLGVRRTPKGQIDSSPSMDGTPMTVHAKLLGLDKKEPQSAISFCSSETMALRVCMAKGTSSCERESAFLETCLGRVKSLKGAIREAGDQFNDWFIQNVSDNHQKPFTHRVHDHKAQHHEEAMFWAAKQGGLRGYGKRPKSLPASAARRNYARRSRLTINK